MRITFLLLITSLLFSCNQDKRYVRRNVHSPMAKADIVAMNKAFQKMRGLPCNNPLSWYYQGAVHWIPDTIKNNPLCASYQDISQLKTAWDNCTHTRNPQEELHFLTWHRLYIWHLEKIVRKLSDKKDFALPYWDYTDTVNVNVSRTMPLDWRRVGSSLYEPSRFDSMNLGYPISSEEANRALSLKNLFDQKTYPRFATTIDNGIHGAIHDYIGHGVDTTKQYFNTITRTMTETGLMGWVPTAGFDPVFWIHHSNIDRLWQQWLNSENGQNVTLEELKSYNWSYTFFDENGKEVVYTMEDIIKIIYTMDYDYDDAKVKPTKNLLRKNDSNLLTKSSQNREIGWRIVSPETKIPVGKIKLRDGMKVTMTVSFLDVPRGVYEVYLNSDNSPHPQEESLLGHMSFFGSDHKVNGQTCIRGCCGTIVNGRVERTFTYEITNKNLTGEEIPVNLDIIKWNKVIHKDLVIKNIVFE